MARLTYAINLSGTGEDGDPGKLKAAFAKVVLALRELGITVDGTLTGDLAAYRDPAGELVGNEVFHDFAGDVPAPEEPAKPKRSHSAPAGKGPAKAAADKARDERRASDAVTKREEVADPAKNPDGNVAPGA